MPHPPFSPLRYARRGFTIIEIVVIIVIVFLMLLIIIPHFLSEMKAGKAQRVKNDLVALDAALDHYARDHGNPTGFQPSYADLRKYLDPNTDVYRREDKDVFGDTYGPFIVGSHPSIPPHTAEKFSGVVSQDFWSPFQ